jgi:hypothetical protein
MEKIIAATFDIADQKCKMYNALEWHNFIADAREESEDPSASLEDLFDELYGDEFWFEVLADNKLAYSVAFDLRSEEFVICDSDTEVDFVMEMAADAGDEEEIFWAE